MLLYNRQQTRDKRNDQAFDKKVSNNQLIQSRPDIELNNTQADLDETLKNQMSSSRKPVSTLEQDYEPAIFNRALAFKYLRSYYIKNEQSFAKIKLFQDTKILKYFGLGPYFYIQFMRRICWLFFFLSILDAVRLYINFRGEGLSNYSVSFSTYLIPSTLGNYSLNTIWSKDNYIMAIIPAVVLLAIMIVAMCWKCHFNSEINHQEQNSSDVKPQKFCIEVESTDEKARITQSGLDNIFSNFGDLHQISIVRRFNGKLEYFQELESIEEEIKEEELQLKLNDDNKEYLAQLKKERQQYLKRLQSITIKPEVLSAYIHFEHEEAKHKCVKYFQQRYLFNTCSHCFMRSCCSCCIKKPDRKIMLNGKNQILIKSEDVPAPEDINWESFEVSCCSFFMRYLFAFIIVILFLVISSTIIGLGTIYISTHSLNCDSSAIPASLAAAKLVSDPSTKTCYCNSNLLSSFSDSDIASYCSSELKDIYLEQGVQIVIIAVEVLTNLLFGVVIDKIINCTKQASQSRNLKVKTIIYSIFLIFNTIFLPILLYSDIFGFKASSYFSFIQIISTDASSFLQVESLQFYFDYSSIWYRNVSPVFTNYIIVDILSVWIMYIVTRYRANVGSLKEDEGKILQKHMNKKIINYQLNIYKEYSEFLMILFMAVFLNSGIPVLLPLATLDLASRYAVNRSLLQNYSTRIQGLGTVYTEISHLFLVLLLVLSGLNAGWMLTANTNIYPNILPMTLKIGSLDNYEIFNRQLYLPFYLGLSILAIGQFILLNLCAQLCNKKCCGNNQVANNSTAKSFSQYKKTMNILTSYNIKSNDDLRNVILRMELYMQNNN